MICRNPDCRAEVNPAALFCGKCSTPVITNCAVCGNSIPAKRNVKWCPQCGTMISEMRSKAAIARMTSTSAAPITRASSSSYSKATTASVSTSSVDSSLHLRSEPVYVGGERVTSDVAPVDHIKTNRSLGMFILLNIITFGLYSIYFFSQIGTDLNRIVSRYDGKKTMHFCLIFLLLTPITFGIATFVWFHKMSDRVGYELKRRGYEKTVGSDTYWLWGVFGTLIVIGPFIYIYKLSGAMNTLAEDYNSRG